MTPAVHLRDRDRFGRLVLVAGKTPPATVKMILLEREGTAWRRPSRRTSSHPATAPRRPTDKRLRA